MAIKHLFPVGCRCKEIAAPGGCLQCTCPDCGAVARFGDPIRHRPDCR